MGILQALALTGSITYGMAIPIIMGQNIGTCVTALLSSIGVNRNAKRVAVIHVSFNVIGSAVCLVLFYGGDMLFHFGFMDDAVSAVGIALCHTIFNVLTTVMLLPFAKQLEKIARQLIRTENPKQDFAFLDPLLLRTPGVAISESISMTNTMGETAHQSVLMSLHQFAQYDEKQEALITENEDRLDTYEDRISSYLVLASQHGVSMKDSRTISRLLHAVGDFERIGDHALNMQESARELHEKDLKFSAPAEAEIQVVCDALSEILDTTMTSFLKDDPELARTVEPLEETIDHLIEDIRTRHIQRLQRGECTIQLGFILSDLLTNMERISDHCSNIAVSVIEAWNSNVDAHAYLHDVKQNSSFTHYLAQDQEKYKLPPLV